MNVSPNIRRWATAAIAAVVFDGLMLLLTLALSAHAEMTHPMMGRLVEVDDASIHAVEVTFEPNEVPENYIDDTGLVLSVRPQAFLFNEKDRAHLDKYLTAASKRYGSIEAPLLSIVASEDKQVPDEVHHTKLLQQLPQMQTYVLNGAGHLPHHTHSEQVIQQIDRFLHDLNVLRLRN